MMTPRIVMAIFLVFSLNGCAAKPVAPPAENPCSLEYSECLKQYATEKMYCITSGETETRCQELYNVGATECKETRDRCTASLPSPVPA